MKKFKFTAILCLTVMTAITLMSANAAADWETEIGKSGNVISTKLFGNRINNRKRQCG